MRKWIGNDLPTLAAGKVLGTQEMTIELRYSCDVHGDDPEMIKLGGGLFCSECIADFFKARSFNPLSIKRIEHDEPVIGVRVIECHSCHTRRPDTNEACPKCGEQPKYLDVTALSHEVKCRHCGADRPDTKDACPTCGGGHGSSRHIKHPPKP